MMRFREGTAGQKALFALIVGLFVLAGLGVVRNEARYIGKPNLGFIWWADATATYHELGMPTFFENTEALRAQL